MRTQQLPNLGGVGATRLGNDLGRTAREERKREQTARVAHEPEVQEGRTLIDGLDVGEVRDGH
ncbi:unannotated protein [freshwater metagenome]|uniref:Unannotated protein n=1 Tax=freshwater metagenome TaxID=449393 RepID=A0A6J7KW15_9ZZZZ